MQKLSPKFDTSKLENPEIGDYIDVYEDQIQGWYLHWAMSMHSEEHAGFTALQIVFPYFEGYAIVSGSEKRTSKDRFGFGFLSVFPEVESFEGMTPPLLQRTISAIYEDGRCGFFHWGLTRKRFMLRDMQGPIRIESPGAAPEEVVRVFLDRRKFVDRVCEHFHGYIKKVRDPAQKRLRDSFLNAMKQLHGTNMPLRG